MYAQTSRLPAFRVPVLGRLQVNLGKSPKHRVSDGQVDPARALTQPPGYDIHNRYASRQSLHF